MKKLIIFTAFFLFISAISSAQLLYGLKAGPQFTRRKLFDPAGIQSTLSQVPLLSLDASLTAFIPLDGQFFIHTNLGYSGKGVKVKNLIFEDQLFNNLGTAVLNQLINYAVLSVPLNYKTAISNNNDLYFGAGPYIGYAISGHDKVKGITYNNGNTTTTSLDFSKGGYRRWDGGLRIEISLVLQKQWMAALSYEAGLTNVANSSSTLRNNALGFSVGYLLPGK